MINNDFYSFNYDLLLKSNLLFNPRKAKSEEFFENNENGEEEIHERIYIKCSDRMSVSEIDILSKPILGAVILFGIFDTYLDSKYPSIQGKTFKQKHDNLPTSNNIEIIQKSFFRIYKLIRNAITHSASSITCLDSMTKINYVHRGTTFNLQIKDTHLIELYTASLLIINSEFDEDRGLFMKEGLLKWYYDRIVDNSIAISDDCSFSTLSDIIPLDPMRDIIVNAQYYIEDNNLVIKNNKFIRRTTRDFAIEFEDECYVIPQEHLSSNSIAIAELYKWKASKKNLLTT